LYNNKKIIYVYRYTNDKEALISNFNVPLVDAPELLIPGEEAEIFTRAWFQVRIMFLFNLIFETHVVLCAIEVFSMLLTSYTG